MREAARETLTSSHSDVSQGPLGPKSLSKYMPYFPLHSHWPQPKSIDKKQSVISKPRCFGYDESKRLERKHRCNEVTSFLEPSYPSKLWLDCPQNFHARGHIKAPHVCTVMPAGALRKVWGGQVWQAERFSSLYTVDWCLPIRIYFNYFKWLPLAHQNHILQ